MKKYSIFILISILAAIFIGGIYLQSMVRKKQHSRSLQEIQPDLLSPG